MKQLFQAIILIICVIITGTTALAISYPEGSGRGRPTPQCKVYESRPDDRQIEKGWPEAADEARPYARWWWLGSAVETDQLDILLDEYARAGLGGLEITPIYGVQGCDSLEIDFLSPQWMEVYRHILARADSLGISIDMNTGTGWPFGGPNIDESMAAKRLDVDSTGQVSVVPTRQKVKRAAPGGAGLVMDHFDKQAVEHYLERFTEAFAQADVPYPHNMFCDSYEVYKADWTPRLAEEFQRRKGYDILSTGIAQRRFDKNAHYEPTDSDRRIISDYREVLGQLLLENFTNTWTDWAHSHGTITRSQAHGSPGNLIDIYAEVDIPECEGFGMSKFGLRGILGLRNDSLTRPNFSDLSMLKYASSAAHIASKPLVSAEAMTWLTEHFRTSLSQCKPELDLFFTAGVNHICFHGTPYSPTWEEWPGWKFYASIDLSPTNTIWRDAPAMLDYITRCQSFLQMGKPDTDLLVYLPIHDMWYENDGTLLMFDINKMAQYAPRFIRAINHVIKAGFDCDYISDTFVQSLTVTPDGKLRTSGGTEYPGLLVPECTLMPVETAERLLVLAQQGAKIVFEGDMPQDVPGLSELDARRIRLKSITDSLKDCTAKVADDIKNALVDIDIHNTVGYEWKLRDKIIEYCGIQPEDMRTFGLNVIRRKNDTGYHYFISNLESVGSNLSYSLGVDFEAALLYDPMTGEIWRARIRDGSEYDIPTEGPMVYLRLDSGQSMILQTFDKAEDCPSQYPLYPILSWEESGSVIQEIDGACTLDIEGEQVSLDRAKPWTETGIAAIDSLARDYAGSGIYTFTFDVDTVHLNGTKSIVLDLGDVRESARVCINGESIGIVWAVPYTIDITPYVRAQQNVLTVEVTNLPANRIAALDRHGVPWRKFKEINMVDRNYKTTTYADWDLVPSGLCSNPRLIIYTLMQ